MLKVVAYLKGMAGNLNEHYPITAVRVPNLDFLTRSDFHENSKDPHSVIEPFKIFASCSMELHH